MDEVIREARDEEIDLLMDVWIRKAEYLIKSGIPVWTPAQFTREAMSGRYTSPKYYVGISGNDIFGCFILLETDPAYWPGREADRAYYFHKFAVVNEFCGRGYSKKILDWVKAYGAASGKDYIRIDFNESRDYLCRLYYGNGFECVRRLPEKDGDRIVTAEYRIR